MLKKLLRKFVVCGLTMMLCTSIGAEYVCSGQVLRDLQGTLVEYTKADTKVIPDKYNTGCQGTLKTVEKNSEDKVVIEGIEIREDADLMRYIFDFYYKNKSVSGTVYIENYDFSDHSFWAYNLDKVDREIKVVFNNCKFSSANFGRGDSKVSFEFNHCTMNSFYGGNTTLNRCQFGKSFSDGVVPFTNIQVNDCFFSDMASVVTDKGAHTDGTQIYGYANLDVENVYYDNCRFAIPAVRPEGSAAYVNACIMLQLEYSSAKNLAFTDCIVNGGGYSIYARSVDEAFTFENVSFDGLRFGCAKRWGVVCSGADKSIAFKNVEQTNSLYIGSVWKENGETHLSVTNDTNRERTLLVYTDRGEYSYTIPACPLVSESTLSMVYTDFPFDMDIVIPADCQYVVCFDNTNTGNGTQIR